MATPAENLPLNLSGILEPPRPALRSTGIDRPRPRSSSTFNPDQLDVARRIYDIGRQRGESDDAIRAALSTGIVESNYSPSATGDNGSAIGVFQQRRQGGYDTSKSRDVGYAANAFYDNAKGIKSYTSPGHLAAQVQRPRRDLRGRYDEELPRADALFQQFGGTQAQSAKDQSLNLSGIVEPPTKQPSLNLEGIVDSPAATPPRQGEAVSANPTLPSRGTTQSPANLETPPNRQREPQLESPPSRFGRMAVRKLTPLPRRGTPQISNPDADLSTLPVYDASTGQMRPSQREQAAQTAQALGGAPIGAYAGSRAQIQSQVESDIDQRANVRGDDYSAALNMSPAIRSQKVQTEVNRVAAQQSEQTARDQQTERMLTPDDHAEIERRAKAGATTSYLTRSVLNPFFNAIGANGDEVVAGLTRIAEDMSQTDKLIEGGGPHAISDHFRKGAYIVRKSVEKADELSPMTATQKALATGADLVGNVALMEAAAKVGGSRAAFGGVGFLSSRGRGESYPEAIGEGIKQEAIRNVFEHTANMPLAQRAATVYAATVAIEKASGATDEQAVKSATTNAGFVGLPEAVGRAAKFVANPRAAIQRGIDSDLRSGQPTESVPYAPGRKVPPVEPQGGWTTQEDIPPVGAEVPSVVVSPETSAPPQQNHELQPRRKINVATGTKGQFKKETAPQREARRAQVSGDARSGVAKQKDLEVVPGSTSGVSRVGTLKVGDKWEAGYSYDVLPMQRVSDLPEGESRVIGIEPTGHVIVGRGDATSSVKVADVVGAPQSEVGRAYDKDWLEYSPEEREETGREVERQERAKREGVGLKGQTVEARQAEVEQPGAIAKVPSESEAGAGEAEGQITGFTTAKGSTYTVSGESTQRTKSLHEGHDPADVGLKEPSVKTLYLKPEDASEVGMWNTMSNSGKRILIRNDEVLLTSTNPKTGERGLDGRFKFTTAPEVGKSPLELSHPETVQGHEGYKGNHPGNAITEVRSGRVPSEGEAGARKENPLLDKQMPFAGKPTLREVALQHMPNLTRLAKESTSFQAWETHIEEYGGREGESRTLAQVIEAAGTTDRGIYELLRSVQPKEPIRVASESVGGTPVKGEEGAMRKDFYSDRDEGLYRGVKTPEGGGGGIATMGKGFYFTADKKTAAYYGEVRNVSRKALPTNPLQLSSHTDFDGWLIDQAVNKLGLRGIREFNKQYSDPGEYIRSLGYDGVQLGKGKDAIYVRYGESTTRAETPPQVQERAKVEKPTSVRAERPNPRTGLTKTQTTYLAGELEKVADRHIAEVSGEGARSPEEIRKSGLPKDALSKPMAEPVTIKVPDDGEFTLFSGQGANNLHKKITGRAMEGFEGAAKKTTQPKFTTGEEVVTIGGKRAGTVTGSRAGTVAVSHADGTSEIYKPAQLVSLTAKRAEFQKTAREATPEQLRDVLTKPPVEDGLKDLRREVATAELQRRAQEGKIDLSALAPVARGIRRALGMKEPEPVEPSFRLRGKRENVEQRINEAREAGARPVRELGRDKPTQSEASVETASVRSASRDIQPTVGRRGASGEVNTPAESRSETIRSRSFPKSAEEAGRIRERSLPKTLEGAELPKGTDLTYEEKTNVRSGNVARERISKMGEDSATDWVLAGEKPSVEQSATAVELIKNFANSGDAAKLERAVTIADEMSRKATEAGQFNQYFATLAKESPEGAVMAAQRAATRRGGKLTSEQAQDFVDTATRLQAAEAKNAEHEKAIADLQKQLTSAKPQTFRQHGKLETLADRFSKREAEARARIAETKRRMAAGELDFRNTGPVPGEVSAHYKDYAIIGAAKLARKAVRFADWADDMVKDFGEKIRPHLDGIYKDSYKLYSDEKANFERERQERGVRRENKGTLKPEDIERLIIERRAKQRQSRMEASSARADLQRKWREVSRTGGQRALAKTGQILSTVNRNALLVARGAVRILGGMSGKQAADTVGDMIAAPIDATLSKVRGTPRGTARLTVPGLTRASINGAYEGTQNALRALRGKETQFSRAEEPVTGMKPVDAGMNLMQRLYSAKENLLRSYAYNKSIETQARTFALNDLKEGKITRSELSKRTQDYKNNPPPLGALNAVIAAERAATQADYDTKMHRLDGLTTPAREAKFKEDLDALMNSVALRESDEQVYAEPSEIADRMRGARRAPPTTTTGKTLQVTSDVARNLYMPFMRRPSNALVDFFQTYVGAPLNVPAQGIRMMLDGKSSEAQVRFSKAVGRGLAGYAIMGLGAELASQGRMTGMYNADEKKRGSLIINGKAYGVWKIPFVGWLLTLGATVHESGLKTAPGAMTQMILEHPFLRGIKEAGSSLEDLANAARSGDKMGAAVGKEAVKVGGQFASRLVPQPLPVLAEATDTKERVTNENIYQPTISRIPWARQTLLRPFADKSPTSVVDPFYSQPPQPKASRSGRGNPFARPARPNR